MSHEDPAHADRAVRDIQAAADPASSDPIVEEVTEIAVRLFGAPRLLEQIQAALSEGSPPTCSDPWIARRASERVLSELAQLLPRLISEALRARSGPAERSSAGRRSRRSSDEMTARISNRQTAAELLRQLAEGVESGKEDCRIDVQEGPTMRTIRVDVLLPGVENPW